MKIVLIANVPTHYRLPLYEAIGARVSLQVIFYSDGAEWYWQRTEQPGTGTLNARTLPGRWVGRTRVTPSLLWEIVRANADVIVKDPNGKFALPVSFLAARLTRKPFVMWASLWEHPSIGLHRFTRGPLEFLYRHSDALVVYGSHVGRAIQNAGIEQERIFVSPQAVSAQLGPPPEQHDWVPPRILFVGRLEAWKGVADLLEAMAQTPLLHLDVVGGGSQSEALRKMVQNLRLDQRVKLLGQIPNAKLAPLYGQAAALVVPSRRTKAFSEPWALVVNEAMQNGCLVIASDAVGAVQDGLVEHDVTGMVFRAGDAASLAECLLRVSRPAEREKFQAAARAGQARVSGYNHKVAAEAFVSAAAHATSRRQGLRTARRSAVRATLARSPAGPALAAALRARTAAIETVRHGRVAVGWALHARETTNFNYPLSPLNIEHLAWFVAEAMKASVGDVRSLFQELEQEEPLRKHIAQETERSGLAGVASTEPAYGRRLAWYALTRLHGSDLVLETGTERGIGTCVLATAVLKNGKGRIITTDPSPTAGSLITGPYASVVEQRRTSTLHDVLGNGMTVDALFHDVHGTEEQERSEYEAVLPHLSPTGIIVNDNAHGYDVLPRLCETHGARYLHFREVPQAHWYSGAGLGVATGFHLRGGSSMALPT